jgi:hypothetical protein
MPRKRTVPPVLRVEGLSTMGAAITKPEPMTFVDELGGNGEELPMVQPKAVSQHVARDHREIAQEAKTQAQAESLSMLVRLGLSDRPDPIPRPLVERIPRGYRKIGEINGKAVLFPLAKWRRV